jgi:RHS repeat-associated protein
VNYLHNDHLGSASVATDAAQVKTQQEYDPWGKLRSGGITQTSINYTGQRLDGTGLLYYHARYYDPLLGRFISPDAIVPSAGALTVAPSDAMAAGLWASGGGGPANPQSLNRFSYVDNNPISRTDPTGHDWEAFKHYALGVGEGALSTLQAASPFASLQRNVEQLIIGSQETEPSFQEQVATVSRGAELVWNDPAQAGAILQNSPREVGQIMGSALATVGTMAAAKAPKSLVSGANSGTSWLYRAVGKVEFGDLEKVGQFRPGGNSVEGKYFAETPGHARQWGDIFFGKGNYRVVGAEVGDDVPATRWHKLDGIGPARFYDEPDLPQIRYTGEIH